MQNQPYLENFQNINEYNSRKKRNMRDLGFKTSFFIDCLLEDKNSLSNPKSEIETLDRSSSSPHQEPDSPHPEIRRTPPFSTKEITPDDSDCETHETQEKSKSLSPDFYPCPSEDFRDAFARLQPDLITSCRDQSLSVYDDQQSEFFIF